MFDNARFLEGLNDEASARARWGRSVNTNTSTLMSKVTKHPGSRGCSAPTAATKSVRRKLLPR